MKRLLSLTIRNRVFVNILTVLALFLGVMGLNALPREIFPEMSIDMILVTAAYPGADPEEVEEGVCRKLEEAIEGLEGVKNFYTYADEGGGAAVIECSENYDVSDLKEFVRERVNRIMDFPDDVETPSVSEITSRQRTVNLSLYGDVDERDLKETARRIKDELLLLPEISQASVSGTRDYEISIDVPEERLRQYDLTLSDVCSAVRTASFDLPAGAVKTDREEITLRTMGRRYTAEEFADLVTLTAADGTRIPLSKIATVRDGFTEDAVLSRFNGKPTALIGVFKTKEEDTLVIAEAVDRYLETVSLPPGMSIEKWRDSADPVRERLQLLMRNGLLGFLLVFLVLWLFLDLRLGFWVSLGIPISLGGGLAVMAVAGQSLNMLSTFALIMVLGIVVDDAIVIGESIYYHRRRGKPQIRSALEGAAEVSLPVIAAVTTTIVAFMPLFFIGGIMGKIIAVVPLAVISALTASLFECLFLLPAHLNDLPDLARPSAVETIPLVGWISRLRRRFSRGVESFSSGVYAPLVGFLLRWRYVVAAGAVAVMLMALGLVAGGIVKFTFFPDEDTEFCIAKAEFPRGTPLDVTRGALERLEKALKETEAQLGKGRKIIVYTNSLLGAQSGYEHIQGNHLCEVEIQIVPSPDRDFDMKTFSQTWQKNVGAIPGVISLEIASGMPGHMGKPVEVWLLGEKTEQLRAASREFRSQLSDLKGVYNVKEDYRPGKRELRIRLKPEARPLGLAFAGVASQVRSAFWGTEAVRVQRGPDNLKVWVRFPLENRSAFSQVMDMRVTTAAGAELPLASMASFSLEEGYARITRKNGLRRLVVSADVNEAVGNASEIRESIKSKVAPQLEKDFPGVKVSATEGQEKEQAQSMASLSVGFSVAAFGIFLVLATIFRSYLQPLVIVTTVPFGFAGVVFAHLLLGYNVTMMSMFGLVALSGIVVNDAIVLVEAVNTRLAMGLSFGEAVKQGGTRRFRPVILTTLTTFFGLMPLIAETSFQAKMLIPMAIAIAFGVAFATLLTLFLLPCELGILNDFRRLWGWVWTGELPSAEMAEPARMRGENDEEIARSLGPQADARPSEPLSSEEEHQTEHAGSAAGPLDEEADS